MKSKLHEIQLKKIHTDKIYQDKGRPSETATPKISYQVEAIITANQKKIDKEIQQGSCYVLATTIDSKELSDEIVIQTYKKQNSIENGFRFLKDPIFFTSSLFVKKQERIESLLMIMTLALLVYSIAERTMRLYLNNMKKTLPNQINKEIKTPTLRWIFQMLEGIDIVTITISGKIIQNITNITTLRSRILACFPTSVKQIYGIDS